MPIPSGIQTADTDYAADYDTDYGSRLKADALTKNCLFNPKNFRRLFV